MTIPQPVKDLWRRGQHGWPTAYPIAQFPNPPLLIAFAGSFIASITDDAVHFYARATFFAGFAIWGWLEVTAGVNVVRRIIGAVALVYVVFRIGEGLGA